MTDEMKLPPPLPAPGEHLRSDARQYVYEATLKRVVDGDTIDADIVMGGCLVDVGLGQWITLPPIVRRNERLRLYGINAYEMHDKDPEKRAKAAAGRDWLVEWVCAVDFIVTIRTVKDSSCKFGRLLAVVYRHEPDDWSFEASINCELIRRGFAVPAVY